MIPVNKRYPETEKKNIKDLFSIGIIAIMVDPVQLISELYFTLLEESTLEDKAKLLERLFIQ